MHESDFCNSFNPPRCKILGVAMEVYAIGHELALIGQGNPLVTYNAASFEELSEQGKFLALGLALEVCGKLSEFSKWLLAVRMHRSDCGELVKAIKGFRDYRAAGSLDLPVARKPRQQGVTFHYCGAPELARLLNYVCEKHPLLIQSHFGGSPLNFPLGLAQILHTTSLESAGDIWVKNHQDMERERPPREGTPPPGANERILTGNDADEAYAEIVASANKGTN